MKDYRIKVSLNKEGLIAFKNGEQVDALYTPQPMSSPHSIQMEIDINDIVSGGEGTRGSFIIQKNSTSYTNG